MTGERYFICRGDQRLGPFLPEELAALAAAGGLAADATLVAAGGGGQSLTAAALLGAVPGAAVPAAAGPPVEVPVPAAEAPVGPGLDAPRQPRVDIFSRISESRTNSYLLLSFFVMLLTALGLALGLALGVPLLGAAGALFLALAMAAFALNGGDQAILSLSGAREAVRADNAYLYNTVEGLSLAAGLPTPKLYLITSAAPNAFATGRDPAHAAVAVTTGLLTKMNRLELEGVVAHELAHVGNYDIRLSLLITALVGSVVLLADGARNLFRFGFDLSDEDRGSGGARLAGAGIALLLGLISPLAALLLQAAISRQREFLADAEGVRLTRYPEGLASALEKIAADTVPLHTANKATAHLFLVNPLLDHGGPVNSLFNTHPPTSERIRRLRSM